MRNTINLTSEQTSAHIRLQQHSTQNSLQMIASLNCHECIGGRRYTRCDILMVQRCHPGRRGSIEWRAPSWNTYKKPALSLNLSGCDNYGDQLQNHGTRTEENVCVTGTKGQTNWLYALVTV